jgi:uncharacterized protein YaiE (UPF0345 family)
MVLDFNGNLGLGTGSPVHRLDISTPVTNAFRISGPVNVLSDLTDGTITLRQQIGGEAAIGTVGAHPFVFRTNNAERMRIDASGNVAIGSTTTVDWRLRVEQAGSQNIALVNTVGNGNRINMADQSWQGEIEQSGGSLLFKAGGTVERMRVSSDGNVGIGTNSPTRRLSIAGGDVELNANVLYLNSGNAFIQGNSTNILFSTNANERARIDGSGNLLVGTSSPATRLTVGDGAITAGASGDVLIGRFNTTFPTPGAGYFRLRTNNTDAENGGITFDTLLSGTLTERARIDAIGNMSLGNSAVPYIAAGRTVFSVNGASSALIGLQSAGANRGYLYADGSVLALEAESPCSLKLNVIGAQPMTFFTSNTERMRIDSSGSVGIGTSSPGSYPYGGLLNVAGGISMALGNRLGWGITDSFTLNGVTTAHYGFT